VFVVAVNSGRVELILISFFLSVCCYISYPQLFDVHGVKIKVKCFSFASHPVSSHPVSVSFSTGCVVYTIQKK